MKRLLPNFKLFLTLVLISGLIFGLDNLKVWHWPKQGLYYITNPISLGLYSSKQAIARQLYFITAARSASQEKRAMQEQLGQLLSENADLRRRLSETQALLDQQKSLDPKTYKLITARPIGLGRFLKIDKGTKDGIRVNEAVVFKDNYIGQVVDVSEKGASVRLLKDPDSKVAAFSFGKDGKAKGVLVGNFGSEMVMNKILHEEQIEPGDLVYSEGTEGFLPRGLILGKVTQVMDQENQVFKTAKVAPLFDVTDLELVFVIQS